MRFFRRYVAVTFCLFVGALIGSMPLAQTRAILTQVIQFTDGPCEISSGSSSPESAVTGDPCDLFLRDDGPPHVYVKDSGSGNTGWAILPLTSVEAGITASTTQTQGNGALTAHLNEVATVANANDTVTLPTAFAGRDVVVINNGANTLQIFPASSDNLGAGVDTSETLAAGSSYRYVAYDATNWEK